MGRPAAVTVTGLVAISHAVSPLAYHVLTDVPFFLGVIAVLVAYEGIRQPSKLVHDGPAPPPWPAWANWSLLVVGLLCAIFARPMMWALVGALLLTASWHTVRGPQRLRHLALGCLTLMAVGLFRLADPRRQGGGAGGSTYETNLASKLSRLERVAEHMGTSSLPRMFDNIAIQSFIVTDTVLAVLATATVLLGAAAVMAIVRRNAPQLLWALCGVGLAASGVVGLRLLRHHYLPAAASISNATASPVAASDQLTLEHWIFDQAVQPGFGLVNGVATLFILGMTVAMVRRRLLWGAFAGLTIGIMVIYHPLVRYFMPLIPIMLMAWWLLIVGVSQRLAPSKACWVVAAMLVIVVGPNLAAKFSTILTQRGEPFVEHYLDGRHVADEQLARWVSYHVEPHAWVISRNEPRIMTFQSRRRMVSPVRWPQLRERAEPVYVLEREARPLLRHNVQNWLIGEPVEQITLPNDETWLLRPVVPRPDLNEESPRHREDPGGQRITASRTSADSAREETGH